MLIGASQEAAGHFQAAINTYTSMLPAISALQSKSNARLEQQLWTERLLHNYCRLVGNYVSSKSHQPEELLSPRAALVSKSILAPFRAWETFARAAPAHNGNPGVRHDALLSRRSVWRAYYDTLSVILQYCSRQSADPNGYNSQFGLASTAARNAELRKVETIYEKLLLKEVDFPKANTANVEVETWADQVMNNWATLTAPTSLDEDLEEGGKPVMSRRVLEVYRLLIVYVFAFHER